jgi:hypothetical protein
MELAIGSDKPLSGYFSCCLIGAVRLSVSILAEDENCVGKLLCFATAVWRGVAAERA